MVVFVDVVAELHDIERAPPQFGRKFDLAQFAWLSRIPPDCGMYLTANIPGSVELGYNGWEGINVSGWSNEAFDAACGRALSLLPGEEGYAEAHQEALRLFAADGVAHQG